MKAIVSSWTFHACFPRILLFKKLAKPPAALVAAEENSEENGGNESL